MILFIFWLDVQLWRKLCRGIIQRLFSLIGGNMKWFAHWSGKNFFNEENDVFFVHGINWARFQFPFCSRLLRTSFSSNEGFYEDEEQRESFSTFKSHFNERLGEEVLTIKASFHHSKISFYLNLKSSRKFLWWEGGKVIWFQCFQTSWRTTGKAPWK